MPHHEKKAFLRFFLIYFVTVSILILAVGFFYFEQVKTHSLKSQEYSMIEYARAIKLGNTLEEFGEEFSFEYAENSKKNFDVRNFEITEDIFIKKIPIKRDKGYLEVRKSTTTYAKVLFEEKKFIIVVQILLLLVFAFISYILAKNAIKPLQKSIQTLDKFAKDLIHDLNTPVTSIKLNMKLLQREETLKDSPIIQRLNRSVDTISELHNNLTILLQEKTFQMQFLNINEIIQDVIATQKQIYPSVKFVVGSMDLKLKLNKEAIKQILQNIISNACKYSSKDAQIKIYVKENALHIQDNGKGIKEPQKIFSRSYSEEKSSGIGLDIVKRLADAMALDIEVISSEMQGTTIILKGRL